jgi:hypothetical protein
MKSSVKPRQHHGFAEQKPLFASVGVILLENRLQVAAGDCPICIRSTDKINITFDVRRRETRHFRHLCRVPDQIY